MSMGFTNTNTPDRMGAKRNSSMSSEESDVVMDRHPTAMRGHSIKLSLVAFACLFLFSVPAIHGDESYNAIVHEHLALETTSPISSGSTESNAPEDPGVAELRRTLAERTESLPKGLRIALPPPIDEGGVLKAIALPAGAILVVVLVVYQLKRRFNALFPTVNQSEEFSKSVALEDPSVAAFFHELRDGLKADGTEELDPETDKTAAAAAIPIKELFSTLPDQLAKLRRLCFEVTQTTDAPARQNLLLDFLREASDLKETLHQSELRPAWLLTCAVAGLLKQVSRNATEVTDSVIKTLTDAMVLLESLCVRGVNPNLASEHPVRLLAVDDDAVSRLAVSFALRQAFDKPDLAPDGESALAMIAKQTYDVIFLDVDMPTMDGYQLCKQIHQTESHRNTPVVFVTSHNDYQSRIMTRLSGGESHIAKPFLTFEITVKALTLVLRSRLNKVIQAVTAPEPEAALPAVSADSSVAAPTPANSEPESSATDLVAKDEAEDAPQLTVSPYQDEFISSALIKAAGEDSPQAFVTHSPAYVAALRSQLYFAREAGETLDQQKYLTRLLMGLRLLTSEANRVERRMVSRMCIALERMLKKLLEQNELCGPAILNAAALALDLIEELSTRPGTEVDLISQPISILVVDDDPVARRALSMAVQMAFGRPEQADSGEAALALATNRAFDLVFLDVLMPGMDGFASCVKIHETPHNRQTPAVFVTGKNDGLSLSQATLAGGAGFISKPVLPTQITLTAMTFVLRNRLNAAESARQN